MGELIEAIRRLRDRIRNWGLLTSKSDMKADLVKNVDLLEALAVEVKAIKDSRVNQ